MKTSDLLGASFLSCALLSACSSVDSLKPFDQQQATTLLQQKKSTYPAKQMVSLALPQQQNWKKTAFSPDQSSSFVILVPEQESPSDFTESLQTRTLPYEYNGSVTAKHYVEAEMNQAKQACREVTATILKETSQYVLYRLNKSACEEQKNQWQIGKVFNGTDGVYSVRYVADAKQITPAHFKTLAQAVEESTLVRDPRASVS